MTFRIEDVLVDTYSTETQKGIRLTHKPTGLVVNYLTSTSMWRATKERLLAELKVLVENHDTLTKTQDRN